MKTITKTYSLLLAGLLLAGGASAQLASDKPTQPAKTVEAQKAIIAPAAPAVETVSSSVSAIKPATEKKTVVNNKLKAVTPPSQGAEPAKATTKESFRLPKVSEQQATKAAPAKNNK
ncbi:MAG: hypothetical protein QM731_04125 [Chitinophagaceae bacterium]